ncbi:hypothetical protein AC623_02660 [Bacillus sp. FJAT-27231]|uniref:methyltransferase domain-containing protein n=1 Tax=Bacillus sp. FJAT-27231 TaxID=1679168 RepID=UPI0006717298|nr:methyltransferase domain-containing protein [Bacillus sp. FJAT-27231]KMY53026.1 hypothetical protein AC623_02660 [Bacillus sp. FJAT-27231]
MTVINQRKFTKESVLEWTVSAESFLQTMSVQPSERILWLGEALSPALTSLTTEKAEITTISPFLFTSNEEQFDVAAAQLDIHFLDEGEAWLRKSFHLLKPGGRLVIDLAETATLQHAKGARYVRNLPDYWDFLREIGFEAIFVQQITALSLAEAVEQGWTELIDGAAFPAAVNRFIVLKG